VTTNNASVAPIKTKNPVKAATTHIFSNVAMILLRMPIPHGQQEKRSLAAEVAVRLPTQGAKIFGGTEAGTRRGLARAGDLERF
jgi:hypothetical protein